MPNVKPPCLAAGCDRPQLARGLCGRHYYKVNRAPYREQARLRAALLYDPKTDPALGKLDGYLRRPRPRVLLEPATVPRPVYDGRGRLIGVSVWSGGLLSPYVQVGLAVTMRWHHMRSAEGDYDRSIVGDGALFK